MEKIRVVPNLSKFKIYSPRWRFVPSQLNKKPTVSLDKLMAKSHQYNSLFFFCLHFRKEVSTFIWIFSSPNGVLSNDWLKLAQTRCLNFVKIIPLFFFHLSLKKALSFI